MTPNCRSPCRHPTRRGYGRRCRATELPRDERILSDRGAVPAPSALPVRGLSIACYVLRATHSGTPGTSAPLAFRLPPEGGSHTLDPWHPGTLRLPPEGGSHTLAPLAPLAPCLPLSFCPVDTAGRRLDDGQWRCDEVSAAETTTLNPRRQSLMIWRRASCWVSQAVHTRRHVRAAGAEPRRLGRSTPGAIAADAGVACRPNRDVSPAGVAAGATGRALSYGGLGRGLDRVRVAVADRRHRPGITVDATKGGDLLVPCDHACLCRGESIDANRAALRSPAGRRRQRAPAVRPRLRRGDRGRRSREASPRPLRS